MRLFERRKRGAGYKGPGRKVLPASSIFFLGALFAISLSAPLAKAQPCGPWVEVEVDPPHPTSNDSITLTLSGVWCDSCVPRSPRWIIMGTTIVINTTNTDPVCLYVLSPWELTVPLGKLGPGRYSVLVIHNGRPLGGLEVLEVRAAPVQILVTAGCVTPPPYSLVDVPVEYQVRDPYGKTIEAGTKKTPFTLAYPQGFQVILDAPDTYDFHRLWQWRLKAAPSRFSPPPERISSAFSADPLTVSFDPALTQVEALYRVMPERKCRECFYGTLGPSDTCGNGTGYSIPGPAGGDPHCQTPDCCGWYQITHVHDLGKTFINVHLILEYTPGFADGCQGTLAVEISEDGRNWRLIYTGPTTTVDLDPPHQLWVTYLICLEIPRMTPFRYVRVTVQNCYVDYSAVYVCSD